MIITHKDHATTKVIHYKIQNANGNHCDILAAEKKRKPYLKSLWHGQDNSARYSKTNTKESETDKEVEIHHK